MDVSVQLAQARSNQLAFPLLFPSCFPPKDAQYSLFISDDNFGFTFFANMDQSIVHLYMVHGLPERKREYGAGILLLERRPADQTKLGLFWAGTSITSHPLSTAKMTKHICLIHEVKVSKITVIARKHNWEDRGRSARAYMVQYIHQ